MPINSVSSPLVHVRQHPDLYLFSDPGLSLAERLVFGLIADAMHLGAHDVRWSCARGRHLVSSSLNWFGFPDGKPDLSLFERVVPLPNASENSLRHEICVTALAEHVALIGLDANVIKGSREAFAEEWPPGGATQSGGVAYGVAFMLTNGQT
jgi:hypothetical protein